MTANINVYTEPGGLQAKFTNGNFRDDITITTPGIMNNVRAGSGTIIFLKDGATLASVHVDVPSNGTVNISRDLSNALPNTFPVPEGMVAMECSDPRALEVDQKTGLCYGYINADDTRNNVAEAAGIEQDSPQDSTETPYTTLPIKQHILELNTAAAPDIGRSLTALANPVLMPLGWEIVEFKAVQGGYQVYLFEHGSIALAVLVGYVLRWLLIFGISAISWRILDTANNVVEQKEGQDDVKRDLVNNVLNDPNLAPQERTELINAIAALYGGSDDDGGFFDNIGDKATTLLALGVAAVVVLNRK